MVGINCNRGRDKDKLIKCREMQGNAGPRKMSLLSEDLRHSQAEQAARRELIG
jgi:hypothetical protein